MTPDPRTRTILRRFRDTGEVIALFPDIEEGPGLVSSYMRVGQHSPASRCIVSRTRPVLPSDPDGLALIRELRSIGYNPTIIRRMPGKV